MDLGIAGYRPEHVAIAQAMGAKWARISYNPFREEPPFELMAHALDHGMQPICNCEGSIDDLGNIILHASDISEWDKALQRYIDGVLPVTQFADCSHIEIWGCNNFPSIVGGRGPQYDYSRILGEIGEQVKAERPDIKLLTGGWGINADVWFLQFGLAKHARKAFDYANMHPLVIAQASLENTCRYQKTRLQEARRILDKDVNGQPLCASIWGIPTVECKPQPEWNYGEWFQLPGGISAIDFEHAVEWYKAFLQLYAEAGFEFVCLAAEDTATYETWTDFCGLCLPGGAKKPGLTDPLVCWLSEHWSEYIAPVEELSMYDDGEIESVPR